jgi:hypothetical protein
MKIKNIHIFGGGTVAHIANHFAVCAPAYGNTGKELIGLCVDRFKDMQTFGEFTKMANGHLETNEDVAARIEELKRDPNTKIIFFNCALVDWEPTELEEYKNWGAEHSDATYQLISSKFGKYEKRLESREHKTLTLQLEPSAKIISNIRTGRKDIFLVGFKTTCGATKQEMYEKGLNLCKSSSVNLVLVNDTKTRWNMIVTPEEAAYHETQDRQEALKQLVDMTYYRSHLTFTQSTVVEGKPVSWNDERVPNSLREVINYCVSNKAYKPFNGATVGHFAVKLSDTEFLTSIRKSNFNDLDKNGLVYVKTDGPDTVIAYGAKPSVGGQSQRIVFRNHKGMDCIAHFHCPLRPNHPDDIPIRSQREVECGSFQCGQNTSDGLKQFGNLKAVMLDQHGPNIVFSKDTDAKEVIDFIERNFDLSQKTGGYNL